MEGREIERERKRKRKKGVVRMGLGLAGLVVRIRGVWRRGVQRLQCRLRWREERGTPGIKTDGG